ncbi:MAG: putative oxidoreductase [Rhodobacteraceae bacterium HLUCCA12]|nr:MAG: putative oxidoreductase [Rhodobacteraceae bacterium HLUCCA12]
MHKIAIIGSGITGLLAGIGLRQQGHDVTIYSALGADDWMTKVPPTGTACRFASSLDLERELGVNHWEDTTPINGIHLTFCPKLGRQLIDLSGRFERKSLAIDVRVQSHRWTHDFEALGGKVVIGTVDIPKLEEIAAGADLTLVAAGKAEIGQLFEVDTERSVYDAPQRNLAMFVFRNVAMDRSKDGIPFVHAIKFNFFATEGEQFSIPYWHKDGFQCWNALFEARPGRAFDKFDDCDTGEKVLARVKELFKQYIPWDYDWIKTAELADPKGWLRGKVRPVVKKPVGTLPSGAKVMALGDTANTLDPIGGQGANNCYRQLRYLLKAVEANTEGDFSADWMNATFDAYFDGIGKATNDFNNLLLEKITPAAQRLLIAQYGSDGAEQARTLQQKIANAFCDNFDDPNSLTPQLLHEEDALRYVNALSGGAARSVDLRNKLKIAKGQVRQVLGMPRSDHPLARMSA